jgi:hypothetical protein
MNSQKQVHIPCNIVTQNLPYEECYPLKFNVEYGQCSAHFTLDSNLYYSQGNTGP